MFIQLKLIFLIEEIPMLEHLEQLHENAIEMITKNYINKLL